MSENTDKNEAAEAVTEQTTPAKLDKMVSVIEIKSWIAFATVFIILGSTIIWGFFGTMQLREDVEGMLVRSGRVFNIYARYDTILLDFTLQPEQRVERDQVIARVEHVELINEINLLIAQNADELEIEAKRNELIARSQIITPDFGRVVDVYAHTGDFVRTGDRLATISREAEDTQFLECFLFMPASQVRNMRTGMHVNVYPAGISSKTYGNMIGVVAYISEYPVTFNYLLNILGSEELAHELLSDGPIFEVYVYLLTSEETVTGYQWTTSLGPSKMFGGLTHIEASIVVDELRPIDVFFFG